MDSSRTATDTTAARWAQEYHLGEKFAINLFRTVAAPLSDQNVFLSPLSVLMCLCLLHNGAAGETKEILANVLGIELMRDSDLDKTLRTLVTQFNADTEQVRIRLANALWLREGFDFKDDFLNRCVESYSASLYNVDFDKPDDTAILINDWVRNATEQMIPQIVSADQFNRASLMVLTNAIFFKGAWAEPFPEERTAPAGFHLANGSRVTVPTMAIDESFRYRQAADHQAVILPYKGTRFSMIAMLPSKEIPMASFLRTIDATNLYEGFDVYPVKLKMPRFEIDFSCRLADQLNTLGLGSLFDRPDLSLACSKPLQVSDVVHKARLTVDEKGSVAAAATGIPMDGAGLPPKPKEPVEMIMNRPFVVAICDSPNPRVLRIMFLGVVANPQIH